MCRTKEQRNELMRFENSKFTFKLSANAIGVRGVAATKTTAVSCAFCGSVKIVSDSHIASNKRRCSELFFCDNECAGKYKKVAYRKAGYQEKIGKIERDKAKLDIEKNQLTCCLLCGGVHKKTLVCMNHNCCSFRRKLASKRWYLSKRNLSVGVVICKECGNNFLCDSRAAMRVYCSYKCSIKRSRRNRKHVKRAANKILQHDISLGHLYRKQKGICSCCGIKTVMPDGVAHKAMASIDHIVPLSKGGLHVWSNVQLLCLSCNSRKGDRISGTYQQFLLMQGHDTPPSQILAGQIGNDGHDRTRQPALKMNFGEAV